MDEAASLNRAIFLDRDGTLNVEVDRVMTPGLLELIDGAGEAVRRINDSGYLAILITNQAVIARGECSDRQLADVHERLKVLLAKNYAHLDAIYYCPHYPDVSGPCRCRKPAPGMILKAQADFSIDLEESWMIGDSVKDIRVARNAGSHAALVLTGKAGSDCGPDDRPDATFDSLGDAVTYITGRSTHR